MTKEELGKLKNSYKFLKYHTKSRVDRNGDRIEWQFKSFEEWLDVWVQSGKLHLRGTHSGGYVMARKGDVGPYSKDNVQIILHSDNIRFARSYWGGPSEEVKAQISATLSGRKVPEEAKKKMSEGQKRRWANTDRSNLNWSPSAETRAKMSAAHKGRVRPTTTCPHCNKVGSSNMKRYHFDNCKSKALAKD